MDDEQLLELMLVRGAEVFGELLPGGVRKDHDAYFREYRLPVHVFGGRVAHEAYMVGWHILHPLMDERTERQSMTEVEGFGKALIELSLPLINSRAPHRMNSQRIKQLKVLQGPQEEGEVQRSRVIDPDVASVAWQKRKDRRGGAKRPRIAATEQLHWGGTTYSNIAYIMGESDSRRTEVRVQRRVIRRAKPKVSCATLKPWGRPVTKKSGRRPKYP